MPSKRVLNFMLISETRKRRSTVLKSSFYNCYQEKEGNDGLPFWRKLLSRKEVCEGKQSTNYIERWYVTYSILIILQIL
uniref:Ovule protein n=1 Tax=Heterorhabditis bacteriophora TaxID=37862 RepID=A0A1I7WU54_HETBA